MSELFSVYHAGRVSSAATTFLTAEYGIDLSRLTHGRCPTFGELRSALDALQGYSTRYTTIAGTWQAMVARVSDPMECTTVVVTSDREAGQEVNYYFERGSITVMVCILKKLAANCGALVLHPHTGDFVIFVDANGATQRFSRSS